MLTSLDLLRTARRPRSPTKDADHELSILLSRQFCTYRYDEPKQAQQKALPFSVFDELAKRHVTELDQSIAQLTIGAAFLLAALVSTLRFLKGK